MKIEKLNIHSYGKIKDKEIKFRNHINIIFGKNESGKSTIMHYIVNSLYGISKNKKSKELSDYDKYLPWSGQDFSGKISYILDNGKYFEVYRDFYKKNPKIYNEQKEEITNNFSIDKSTGNQFFYEQTKVDEELFLSTVVSNQQEVKLGKTEQVNLIQKIANLVGTGDDKTSFRIAMDRINRRQLEEIGTARTREKPINNVQKKIVELQQEKSELEKYENEQYVIEEKISEKKEEISNLELEMQMYRDIKNILAVADSLISTSKREGLAVNILEGLASGKIVIASDNRGNRPAIKNGKTGFLISNKEELIESMKNVINHKEKMQKEMKTDIENTIQQYSIEVVKEQLKKIYKSEGI